MKDASIYLDHSASTPIHPEVLDAMIPFLQQHFGNPSSLHRHGRTGRRAIEKAREEVASLIGSEAREIIFTGSGTEANNMIVRGFGTENAAPFFCSPMEHRSILDAHNEIHHNGIRLTEKGGIVFESIEEVLLKKPRAISVMTANNETGVMQSIRKIADLCEIFGTPFHSDATQAMGKFEVNVRDLGIDALTFSAHKIEGPKGVGACFLRHGSTLSPLIRGGSQEGGNRAGTEDVARIVGFGRACKLAKKSMSDWEQIEDLRDAMERQMIDEIPNCWINGEAEKRLPNISNIGFEGLEGEAIMRGLDAVGISVGTGSACSSGAVEASHVLLAMGQSHEKAHSAIRISLGRNTHEQDVKRIAKCLPQIVYQLRSRS